MAQPHYISETQIVHRVVKNPGCRFIWTNHALEKMQERDISVPDIENALTSGHVVLSEAKQDDVWRVDGRDIDGDPLTVEVVVGEDTIEIKVVTTFRSKRRM